MQLKNIFTAALCVGIFGLGLDLGRAQTTASWIGPASGGEWNNGAFWDTGLAPTDATVNAVIAGGTNVSYNLPMAAASFGTLALNGTLNVNTNGFNSGTVTLIRAGGGNKLFLNPGGAMNVGGNLAFCSNSVVTVANGSTLTINGTLIVGCGTSGSTGSATPGSFGIMTNLGGTISANATSLNPGNGSVTTGALLVINGGTNNLGTVTIKRSAASSSGYSTLGTEGIIVNGGQVTMTNANVGGAAGNSFLSMVITGGAVTNDGSVFINQGTGGSTPRGSRVLQTGGLFVVPDPGVVNPNPTVSGSLNTYAVLGGTNIVGGLYLGNSNSAAGTVNFTNAAVMYIGSQGIAWNGVATLSAALNNGGLLGAMTPWTGSAVMKLNGGSFTFKTADMNNTPNNITLLAALTGSGSLNLIGGGILTLGAANTYSGNTLINGGTLAMSASGTLTSPKILVGSGAIFDVSQVSGYTLNAGQTLAGFGTVTGLVTAAASATIYPGSNSVTGTLTLAGGLVENGGVNTEFNLSSNPAGPGNDFINTPGGLTLSGANTIVINGALAGGGVYPLINYGGNLTGDVSGLTVSGATGTFSNSPTDQIIYFIAQSSVRGPTNITWVGNATVNDWNVEISTNWLNNGTGALDFFVPNDTAQFSDLGAVNPLVNIPGNVTPGGVIVNTTSNYTFSGPGAIVGVGGLTVSNGVLNVLTINAYTGPTILAGGMLVTPNLANSGSPSGIGAASPDAGNLVLNGGTLAYTGASVGTDHSLTLTNTGGTLDVINGTTLTLNGTLTGNGALTLVDTGTLALTGVNGYSGGTFINNGTLNVNNVGALGTGVVNLMGGSLALVSIKPANTINAGGGWISGGNAGGLTGIKNVTGSAHLGITVTASSGVFDLTGDMTAFSGTISFTNGGGGSVRLNGSSGSALATWDLGPGPMDLNVRTSAATNSFGALQGAPGTTLSGRGGASNNGSTTHFIGGNNQDSTFDGVIQNGSGGSASSTAVTKVGTGTLSLSGANTYTGTTTISSGTLALINNGSMDDCATINIVAGAVLDVSSRSDGTYTIGNNFLNQVLEGRGTILGNLVVGGNTGTVVPGGGFNGGTGTLTVTNAISLGGTAWMKLNRANTPNSDQLVSTLSTVTYGGTLVVTNIGAALRPGDTFYLFSGAGLAGGSFGSIVLPVYYNWDTSQLGVNGSVTVTSAFTPSISGVDFSTLASGSILLSATNGPANGPVTVLTSTNLALPLSSWTVYNNTVTFDGSGNLNGYPIAVDPTLPQQFITLKGSQ